MNLSFLKSKYLREQFDFRLAGRWLVYGTTIGTASGLGAIVFQLLLSLVKQFSFNSLMGLDPSSAGGEVELFHLTQGSYFPALVILVPTLGGLISGWVVYTFAPEAEGHGTDEVIKAYHRKRGIIKYRVPIVKMISSVITIGTGGSGGREGPIAQIGAGFGSFLAGSLGLNTKSRRWLLAAGMGAGIGSIFHAPLAGAIFAAEVLYSDPELEAEVLLPATVSSIIAYTIYSMAFGWQHMFIESSGMGFSNPLELIPYLVLGIGMAFVAHLFVRVFYGVNGLFARLKINRILKPAIGGLLTGSFGLAIITLMDDQRYVVDIMGGGYGILQEIFNNGISNVGIMVLLIIGFGKIFTTSFSIGSGGSAGVFGPSMVIGGTIGGAFGFFVYNWIPAIVSNPISFAIVGMAGFFAAAANTPLSTVIMVSELTGNYSLLLPTMWVCFLSYFVAKKWSIYRSQVPNMNYSQAHFGKFSPDIINETTVGSAYKKSRRFKIVHEDSTIQEILGVIDRSRQRIFPVVNEDGKLLGGFNIDDITHVLNDQDTKIQSAKDLMYTNIPKVYLEDSLDKANGLMNDNFMDEALVIDDSPNEKVLGLITSSDIVLTYNRRLSDIKYGDESSYESQYDNRLLKSFSLKSVLETDLLTIKPEDTLGELVGVITKSDRNIFPVVDSKDKLHGIILLNDVRSLMFDSSKYGETKMSDLMRPPPDVVHVNESMQVVIDKFERTRAWNLPVVDRFNRYLGLVSKSSIFSVYRNQLIKNTEV